MGINNSEVFMAPYILLQSAVYKKLETKIQSRIIDLLLPFIYMKNDLLLP